MNDDRSPESDKSSGDRDSDPAASFDRDLNGRRNASEIAGETIDVVGERTGRFPRVSDGGEGERTGRHAFMVGAGILISRIIGVIRQRVFAHYLGFSDAAGAFSAAFPVPNFFPNGFCEGALPAPFTPGYANLLARGDKEEASRVADAVLTLLALTTSIIVLAGVLTTRFFVGLFAASFDPATRELTIQLIRIFFPGAGLLVLSAWCLGVLHSHRKFFLSYTAPVVWNLAIIATLMWFGGRDDFHLATFTAWGSVIGSALQFGEIGRAHV